MVIWVSIGHWKGLGLETQHREFWRREVDVDVHGYLGRWRAGGVARDDGSCAAEGSGSFTDGPSCWRAETKENRGLPDGFSVSAKLGIELKPY